jgi:hypothetical protein
VHAGLHKDLVVVDEVLIASPPWIDLDQRGRNGLRTELGNGRSDVDRDIRFGARGALLELISVSRIMVFCSVLSNTLVLSVDVELDARDLGRMA